MYDIVLKFLSGEEINRKCVKEFSITSDTGFSDNKVSVTVQRLSNRLDNEIFRNVDSIRIIANRGL